MWLGTVISCSNWNKGLDKRLSLNTYSTERERIEILALDEYFGRFIMYILFYKLSFNDDILSIKMIYNELKKLGIRASLHCRKWKCLKIRPTKKYYMPLKNAILTIQRNKMNFRMDLPFIMVSFDHLGYEVSFCEGL